MAEDNKKLVVVVDRREGDWAILKFPGGQTVKIETDLLPEGAAEGAALDVFFSADEKATRERSTTAKALLNELLKNSGE